MFKASTGKGYQPKWTSPDDQYWYKADLRGGEGFIIL